MGEHLTQRLGGHRTELAVATHDEHAIKFLEVALKSHQRGNQQALPAAARAATLIGADE